MTGLLVFSATLLIGAVYGHPQYQGPAADVSSLGAIHDALQGGGVGQHQQASAGYPVCDLNLGLDCVPLGQCVNGVIDTSGASAGLDLRGGPKQTAEKLGYTICGLTGDYVQVCCQIPDYVPARGVEGAYIDDILGTGAGTGAYVEGSTGVGSAGHGGLGGAGHAGVGGAGHGGLGGAGHAGVGGAGHGGLGGVGGSVHSNVGGVGTGAYVEPVGPVAPLSGPPYPQCSAGLLCVEEITCNLYTGYIGDRIPLFEGQPFIEYQHCTTPHLAVGVCCREPEKTIGGVGHGVGNVGHGVGGVGHGVGGVGHGVGGVGHSAGGIGGVSSHSNAGAGHGNLGHGGSGVGVGVGGAGHSGVGGGVHGGLSGTGGAVHSGAGGSLVSQCGVYEECVLKEYCNKGIIGYDGAGLLDLRGKQYTYNSCIDPEYPDAPAVCCRPDTAPLVEGSCPAYEVCTDYQSCNPEGYVAQGNTYDVRYSIGTECYKNPGFSALTGVCCKSSCPVESTCIPESNCFGNVLDNAGAFVPYSPGAANWNQCFLKGSTEPGVCCTNPPPVVPPPAQCGVSQYAQDNSLKTRYKTPAITKLEADFGEFPWQAIVFFSNYTFRCGATIISDKHLLTAAHCVRDHEPYDFRIRVGEWQVNTFTEPYPYHDFDVASITFHPKYKRGAEHNNIVIIELAAPMTLAYNVNAVCLPENSYVFAPGTRCFVSGWGKDSFTGDYQHILKKVDVPIVGKDDCQYLLRQTRLGRYFRLHKSFICAGGEQGKDACTGDGGGPLVCLNNNNQYVLAGITSWGIGCGVQDVPGVYTDVGHFVNWILENTQSYQGFQYGR